MNLRSFGKALVRRKKIDDNQGPSTLNRCLGTFDLTALGIGSTLGLGMYVIAGKVASTEAGPAVVLSFFFAALASIFAGFCYAEFGARVPRAGSAYVYSYVTVGEFTAFVIGWNLILEYVIGTASVARGYSGYIDSLFNGSIAAHFEEWMPLGVPNMSAYPDFLALGITLLLTVMLAIGVKESTRFNSVFTFINLSIVVFVIVCGSFKSDFSNWKLPKSEVPPGAGNGGFLPFGFSGMMAGAATCFYSFIGFDIIATTGEEVRNPQKAIPISIVVSLLIIFLAYFGVSSIQTLMWPYYDLNNAAPLPYVFDKAGLPFAKWIITVGALAGLSTSLMGAMFPLPRVLYAMATDGLIFRFLANVNARTKTPLISTFVSGILSGIMAALFDVDELADMMSIGTLLAYTLVAVSILVLRFEGDTKSSASNAITSGSQEFISDENQQDFPPNSFTPSRSPDMTNIAPHFLRRLFNLDNIQSPTKRTSSTSKQLILSICTAIVILDLLLIFLETNLSNLERTPLIVVGIAFFYLIFLIIALGRQPRSSATISFQVPWVPFIPIISIFINVYLMMKLSVITWVRFAVWMAIGLSIYFIYGIFNSNERSKSQNFQLKPTNQKAKDQKLSIG
ncbi:high affinity cationic amino acid transporter 1-like isoform X2 [Panonychus citri]|uniref:high affinity cationic amino acid transporter 1-like isoform X2 n=1 Tax=Panonychus citri TaxID=50023 RepID=UPI002307CE1F|nr:high affinity cationic amino acid transporter 1-like isoform X2 [Panonychus citri]